MLRLNYVTLPIQIKKLTMNYEEMLEAKSVSAIKKEKTPFGLLYKKMEGNKYLNNVDLRPELTDNLVFCDDLDKESKQNLEMKHKCQMHFTVNADDGGTYGVTIAQGTYHTFENLLVDNPALVAQKDFIENTIKDLLEFTDYLHSQNIQHVCYAPSNVFARKNDNALMLLFHGSAYANLNDQHLLYDGCEDFLAPEVLGEGTVDERSDIYSIGKFIAYLYQSASVPFELKSVIAKATNENPDKRYQSAHQMLKAINMKRKTLKSIITFVSAAAIALLCFGLYFSMLPEQEDIEFVKPAPAQEEEEDILSGGIDPITELGAIGKDNIEDEQIDEKKMREYEAKAEQIFRRQFTKEAERIISKVYDNSHLNGSEKQFITDSHNMMEELVKAQVKLGGEAGLSDAKSQRIASDIIERVTNQKKAEMNKAKTSE